MAAAAGVDRSRARYGPAPGRRAAAARPSTRAGPASSWAGSRGPRSRTAPAQVTALVPGRPTAQRSGRRRRRRTTVRTSAEEVLAGGADDLGPHRRLPEPGSGRRPARSAAGDAARPCPSPARRPRPARRPPPPRWHLQLPAEASAVPRRSTTAAMPAHADGDVGEAPPPRAARTCRTRSPPPRRRRGPAGRRGCGGPSGRSRRGAASPGPGRRWTASTPALAHTKPCGRLADDSSPRRRSTRTDSCSTRACQAGGSSASTATSRPSALDTTFWVTTTTSRSCSADAVGDEVGQHVARARPRAALDGQHLDAVDRSLVPGVRAQDDRRCGQAAASAGPRMIVGATTQRTPSASTAAARSASASSTTSVDDERRVEPGHADDRRPRGPARPAAGRPGP